MTPRATHSLAAAAALLAFGLLALEIAAAAAPARRSPRPSVAFSPDGRRLAAAGYRTVDLLDAASGKLDTRLPGLSGSVTCVAFSPDGTQLAASGGVPGRSGEIRVWDLGTGRSRAFEGVHTDVVYAVAWGPTGKTLAACGYDRLVSVWAVETGKGRALKDHTDAVYAVAFSSDGKHVASASGDRTVKVWDPTSGRRLFTLSDSTAELYSVAFRPTGGELAAGGVDRMLRKWTVAANAGTLAGSAFAHDGPVLRVLYTPDGQGIYTSSEDRSISLWDARTLTERPAVETQPDWPLGLALSPAADRLAVSRYDGSLAVYATADGARRMEVKDVGR